MYRWAVTLLAIFVLFSQSVSAGFSDSEIRQILINRSIAAYPGNCPCPYNLDRAGRRCGARSAYSKHGACAPVCYRTDVTDEMIAKYRRRDELASAGKAKRIGGARHKGELIAP